MIFGRYLFERKALKLYLINADYHVIPFTVMGFILGVWKYVAK